MLSFGREVTIRSDQSGIALPTFEPGQHEVSLELVDTSGRSRAVDIPSIRYFVSNDSSVTTPLPLTIVPLYPLSGTTELDPMDLAFRWRGEQQGRFVNTRRSISKSQLTSQGFVGYRVEMEPLQVQARTATLSLSQLRSATGTRSKASLPDNQLVINAETSIDAYRPTVDMVLQLSGGRYRWRVVGYPADSRQAPVEGPWTEVTLRDPPPPGNLFIDDLRLSTQTNTDVLPSQANTSIDSGPLNLRQRVTGGQTLQLLARIRNTTFYDQGDLTLQLADNGQVLYSESVQDLAPQTEVSSSMPWQVPSARASGAISLNLLRNGQRVDQAEIEWQADKGFALAAINFQESSTSALEFPITNNLGCNLPGQDYRNQEDRSLMMTRMVSATSGNVVQQITQLPWLR